MFFDKFIVLFIMGCIMFFGGKWIYRNYFVNEEEDSFDSVDAIAARKALKEKMLAEYRAKFTHLSDEITLTDDLILMKNNVEVSEDELAVLDEALAEKKVNGEDEAEVKDEVKDEPASNVKKEE